MVDFFTMRITLNNIGKRYNYEWIFRKVNYEFTNDNSYVILGANGSGKSTLLQVIAGNIIPSEGELQYLSPLKKMVVNETFFRNISFAAPYLELFEEFTLTEAVEFQAQFKPFKKELDINKIIELTELEKVKNKQLKQYSSGMKQRVKLALAILSSTPVLLLDEPTSNLDKKAISWYQNLIKDYSKNRLIIVCSNQLEYEYPFCNIQMNIEDYK